MAASLAELTSQIHARFAERLMSVLLYGSTTKHTSTATSDIDLILVLMREDGKEHDDIRFLRDLIAAQRSTTIDFQLMYEDELTDSRWLSLDTHGAFISLELHEAEVLYGHNPFLYLTPSRAETIMSVVRKLQYYVFRLRQLALGHPLVSKDSPAVDFHRKKLAMAITDISYIDPTGAEKVLSRNIRDAIDREHPLTAQTALTSMELLYGHARLLAEAYKPQRMERIRISNVTVDMMRPQHKNGKALILCDGLPSAPASHREFMSRWTELGFLVLLPHYRGTWESDGTFLESSPAEDVRSICEHLEKEGIPSYGKPESVQLLGTSFGGAVCLCAGTSPLVNKIIVLSPVLRFSSLLNGGSLYSHLANEHAHGYRVSREQWGRLLQDNVLNPASEAANIPKETEVVVMAGSNDTTIPLAELKEFASRHGFRFESFDNRGHLSFTDAGGALFAKILKYCLS